ncbi:hypothetical protein MMC26_000438 [Xylographa opegraphella]|nr:hypothetical protein [Xylographa opegraphella]
MTKALTAAAIGILVEDGRLQWDTPVHTILPCFAEGHGPLQEALTITDLLSHRSGIISPDTFFLQDNNTLLLNKHEAIRTFNYGKEKEGFRDSFLYSNFSYAVAGLVIEHLSGQEYGTFLQENFFAPLGLHRTTTEDISKDTNIGKSYSVLEDRSFWPVPGPKVGTGTLMEGAAGIKSTVNDLLILYKAFIEACNDQRKKNTTSTDGSPFRQCNTLVLGHNFLGGTYLREQSYGLGWVRCQLPGPLGRQAINARLEIDLPITGDETRSLFCLYHQGLMPGSSTVVYSFPETETAVVVLQNATALNDCPDWVGQLLVQTIFNFSQKNDYLDLATRSAKKSLALVPSIGLKLDSERIPNTNFSLPLNAYTGRYFSPIKNFFIEVSLHGKELQLAFQGLESQTHSLRHYHYDTFTWQMTHNEAAKKARLMVNYPAEYFLLRFGTKDHDSIDRLYWIIETTHPNPEVFRKADD